MLTACWSGNLVIPTLYRLRDDINGPVYSCGIPGLPLINNQYISLQLAAVELKSSFEVSLQTRTPRKFDFFLFFKGFYRMMLYRARSCYAMLSRPSVRLSFLQYFDTVGWVF